MLLKTGAKNNKEEKRKLKMHNEAPSFFFFFNNKKWVQLLYMYIVCMYITILALKSLFKNAPF